MKRDHALYLLERALKRQVLANCGPLAPGASVTILDSRADAIAEQLRQFAKWGPQYREDGTGGLGADIEAIVARHECDAEHRAGNGTWRSILKEEFCEAMAEKPNSPELRNELVQVAAVCLTWIDDIDSRG